ncbi:hypothetical protein F5Y07DRAFT_338355 [Xylaria sp. FL0933]|nr:hypothetical protein F5Y07DRAFT_338355 [Xylaria sp. FL0933]
MRRRKICPSFRRYYVHTCSLSPSLFCIVIRNILPCTTLLGTLLDLLSYAPISDFGPLDARRRHPPAYGQRPILVQILTIVVLELLSTLLIPAAIARCWLGSEKHRVHVRSHRSSAAQRRRAHTYVYLLTTYYLTVYFWQPTSSGDNDPGGYIVVHSRSRSSHHIIIRVYVERREHIIA